MAKKMEVKCVECEQVESFGDAKDVTYAKWQIIAWNINENTPIVLCNKCEYGDSKKKKSIKT